MKTGNIKLRMIVGKKEAAELLGICRTNFSRGKDSRWGLAVTKDNRVDMDIAYRIQDEMFEKKEREERLKAFSQYLRDYWGISFSVQSMITGINLTCLYTNKYRGERIEPLIRLMPVAWDKFNEYYEEFEYENNLDELHAS